MAIVPNNSQLNSSLESMLQGLAFWMGYSKSMNELYEHDCVHQAFTILRAGLLKEDRTELFEKLIELGERYKRVNQYQ